MTGGRSQNLDSQAVWDYINTQLGKRVQQSTQEFTKEDIASVGFNLSQLAEAIGRVVSHPSKYQITQFRTTITDRGLLNLLETPDVSLGLELKEQYDRGTLDIFDKVLEYQKRNRVDVEDDPIMTNFMDDSEHFLPPKPLIEDEDLSSQIKANKALTNLTQVGRDYYESFISHYLTGRFSGFDVNKIDLYAINHRVASQWARLYEIPVDLTIAPYETFFAYVGALVTQLETCTTNLKYDIDNWITILLEPLLMQFDKDYQAKINAKDEIRSFFGDRIEFRNIYTSTNADPIYLVQIYVDEDFLVSTASATSLSSAEAKASSKALEDKKKLNKIKSAVALSVERKLASSHNSLSPQTTDHGYAYTPGLEGHFEGVNHPGFQPYSTIPHGMQMANPASGGSYPYSDQSRALVKSDFGHSFSQDAAGAYPQGLVNQDYQRQLQEESDAVILVPMVTDEATVDISSKEKLNHLLIANRFSTAEYKTAKLNNSDVQVTCSIENMPMTRAIFTNKKKAGQICAQYILNHWELFHNRLNDYKNAR